MNVHRFLHRYFQVREQRRSPRCVSIETARHGSYEGAMAAQDWWTWSVALVGRAERDARWTAQHSAVLECVFLRLAVEHVPILEGAGSGSGAVREISTVVSWRGIARYVLKSRSQSACDRVRALFFAGVDIVREQLREPAEEGVQIGA